VWGILITFGELQAGHSVSSNSIILGGLSTALTTTVLGLLIAIPALIAYNYLKNLSHHFTTEMRDFSHFLLSTVELQYRKVDIE
jgi:biopolymer transport protein TolQ